MRAGGNTPPWPILLVFVLLIFFLMSGFTQLALLLLFGGLGIWLVVSSVRGLRPQGKEVYWRGQRIRIEEGTDAGHIARSVFAITLGLALIAFATWWLLLR